MLSKITQLNSSPCTLVEVVEQSFCVQNDSINQSTDGSIDREN